MNSRAIADALAGRFTGVTATVGSTTESIVVGPTAKLPNSISHGPALIVYHPTGDLSIGVNKRREDVLDFPVRMLRDPLGLEGRSEWLYAWYDALRDRVEMNMDLDLAYVAWAMPVAARVELGGENYPPIEVAGVTPSPYDVVEILVRVRLNEIVSTVAP